MFLVDIRRVDFVIFMLRIVFFVIAWPLFQKASTKKIKSVNALTRSLDQSEVCALQYPDGLVL